MELMTMTAFAALHSVSKPAVTRWKKRGLLVFEGDLVDVEASDANLQKYRSAPRSARQIEQPSVKREKLPVQMIAGIFLLEIPPEVASKVHHLKPGKMEAILWDGVTEALVKLMNDDTGQADAD
ncbi:MAG: hypothetical protein ABSC19_19585 [Syntrophorhabdales bacterium]|jgi:hypothetical protein